ncbi:hypothetical protein [Rhizobium leguminosarum]|uniref:hypothetical protein n=1 Tax=Rhizobium leguminosarum TaxID=384 RepID=UPI001C9885EE|nr:hypothetical protein [Rhizobium leguminosarum]MBY5431014.1 hypothetical protein [Rhizobium leguminosarum]
MSDVIKTAGDWYEQGLAEGTQAGGSEIEVRIPDFGPLEDALAMGHAVLNGRYATVRRRQADFRSFEDLQAWLGGVVGGIESVGARVGFQTTIEYPNTKSDGGAVTFILVVRDACPEAQH